MEDERLAVLASFDLDGLDGDEELARIARFAARLCGTPTALVSLVESERQRFIARSGLEAGETPRSTSFCAHTMLGAEILEVLDASTDERFRNFALVTGPENLRYYAGAPLISSEGASLGSLCVIDYKPHATGLDDLQSEGLLLLAEAVKRRLEAHRQTRIASFELESSAERLQFMLDSVPDIAWSAAPGPVFDYFNARFSEVTGMPPRSSIEDWREVIHPDDFEATSTKFSHSIDTATAFEDEWRLRLADGSYRWVLSRAVPSSSDPASCRWFGTLTDIDDSYKLRQERELLAGELAHRIKNIFSVIIGLITLQSRGDRTTQMFADMIAENIRALARAQEFALKIDNKMEDNLQELLSVLMAPYGVAGRSAVSITGDQIAVGKRAATPLALVFHELATNSAKYGALSVAEGALDINVEQHGEEVSVVWTEKGGPPPKIPKDKGFGSRLINTSLNHQLGGRIDHDWRPEGLRATVTMSAKQLAE